MKTKNQTVVAPVGEMLKSVYTWNTKNTLTFTNMKTYNVYRTVRGNLTFTEQQDQEPQTIIRAQSQMAAKNLLNNLKKLEKRDGV